MDKTYVDNDTLLELIAAKLDVEEILDILGWETYDLVLALNGEILSSKEQFLEAIE